MSDKEKINVSNLTAGRDIKLAGRDINEKKDVRIMIIPIVISILLLGASAGWLLGIQIQLKPSGISINIKN